MLALQFIGHLLNCSYLENNTDDQRFQHWPRYIGHGQIRFVQHVGAVAFFGSIAGPGGGAREGYSGCGGLGQERKWALASVQVRFGDVPETGIGGVAPA